MITQQRLKEFLDYNPDTGVFTWRESYFPSKIGKPAGGPFRGYLRLMVDGKLYLCHRLAWLYVHGDWPTETIDHINGIKSDNRIKNLRAVSHMENCQNRPLRKDNSSGISGVCWDKSSNHWRATIAVNGKRKHLIKTSDLELPRS